VTWATFSAFIQALPALIRLFQSIANYATLKQGKEAGRAEAVAEAATLAAQQIDAAAQARQEAEAEHNKHPDDDDGFDKDFQRQ
jgi:hypothetical protein